MSPEISFELLSNTPIKRFELASVMTFYTNTFFTTDLFANAFFGFYGFTCYISPNEENSFPLICLFNPFWLHRLLEINQSMLNLLRPPPDNPPKPYFYCRFILQTSKVLLIIIPSGLLLAF